MLLIIPLSSPQLFCVFSFNENCTIKVSWIKIDWCLICDEIDIFLIPLCVWLSLVREEINDVNNDSSLLYIHLSKALGQKKNLKNVWLGLPDRPELIQPTLNFFILFWFFGGILDTFFFSSVFRTFSRLNLYWDL